MPRKRAPSCTSFHEVIDDILMRYRVAGASLAVLAPTGDGDAVVRAQVRAAARSAAASLEPRCGARPAVCTRHLK